MPATAPLPLPNMRDYERARRSFSWARARAELAGLPGGGLNIAHEAVDRHATGPLAGAVALRFLARDGSSAELTYAQLLERTQRFAAVLSQLGVARGERVFALAGRIPELYVAALGTLRHGAVFCPLFSAFGPEPVEQRLRLGDGRVLLTTPALYRRKVAPLRERLPSLAYVLVAGDEEEVERLRAAAGDARADGRGSPRNDESAAIVGLPAAMAGVRPAVEVARTAPEDMALLHFTSGTTGAPKGAVHVHEAVVAHHATGAIALDLHPDDVFWCTADPGWVTGTSYGILAPLTHGVRTIVDEADFQVERWYEILQRERVTVWYTAPTAIRMLMRAGAAVAHEYDLSALRFVASVGEPLNPEAVRWGEEAFGMPIHDNWWQTETGGIMIANYRSMPVRPGSMGKPLPGIEAAIARRGADGRTLLDGGGALVLADDERESGELVLRPGWPSMFRGYLGDPDRYGACFRGGWYLTGDLARRDRDGYFWFVGRGDDVIKSAGHLIGPFEVESVLLEHPAVAEAGVIGKPDEVAGEIVKAFVALGPDAGAGEGSLEGGARKGSPGSGAGERLPVAGGQARDEDALRRELLAFARTRLGAAVAPREIDFVDSVPRNRSGKIVRRLLKARELGLPEGDTSTLEPAP